MEKISKEMTMSVSVANNITQSHVTNQSLANLYSSVQQAVHGGSISSVYIPTNQFVVDYSYHNGSVMFSYDLSNKLLSLFEIENIDSIIENDLRDKSLCWINGKSDDFSPVSKFNEFRHNTIEYKIVTETENTTTIDGKIYHYVEVMFFITSKKDGNQSIIKGKGLLTHSEFLKIKLSS